eukprot:364585-Chlamydomonas_euryale.AAC.3
MHTGTEAVVRVDGAVGRSLTVKAGVRQGCVIKPMLFNVFVDHILQEALSQPPPPLASNLAFKLVRSRAKYELFLNAPKTEIMVFGRPMTLPTFQLSGKELLVTDSFKYLGLSLRMMGR